MQGSGACWPGPQELGARAEMLERRREPASHGTVKLRLRKPSNAPQGQRIGGYLRPGLMGLRRNKKLNFPCKSTRPQGACGPGAFSPQKPPTSQITITAASEVGTWRETKPGYPPYRPRFGAIREKGRGFSPSPPSATIQHAPQGRRIAVALNSEN